MIPVLLGFGAFAAAFALHICVWRVRLPASPMRAAALIFAAGLALAIIAGWCWLPGFGVADAVYVALLYGSMAASYLLTYTGLECDSPTLSIVYRIAQNGDAGVTVDDLQAFMRTHPFVMSRLTQLYRDGFVRDRGNHLELSERSRRMLKTCDIYRRLMGRESEGG